MDLKKDLPNKDLKIGFFKKGPNKGLSQKRTSKKSFSEDDLKKDFKKGFFKKRPRKRHIEKGPLKLRFEK
ncbi:hypothetical protein BpHYR1_003903 [Brachionus plicatilis]|uniref:Uncharacterized protein n=1 Tax=Brachionus plicatilis TaxID=10195 RepID=A0A3M7QFA4_BRAPC|nr:hypothetical protein BpHYR1_003903 [Brachionus plicatilis]